MNLILLSGGSGRRLWPLSNDTRSKQFLRLLKNDCGETESMVQRVFRQIQQLCPTARITVATGAAQADAIAGQLGEAVDVAVEPERRDTFPAIVLAAAHLVLEKGCAETESVAILPVDAYAEQGYFETVDRMVRLADEGAAELVLMGIEPTYPSEKYGYILPADGADPTSVRRFTEKPDEATAAVYIREGALWNGGVFACKLGYLANIARKYIAFDSFAQVRGDYGCLPKISFDYEVVEKAKSIAVTRYRGKWKDLGTWNTLTEEMTDAVVGEGVEQNCTNTHVVNELDIPFVALGIDDAVIAVGADGILVSKKDETPGLKPIADRLAGQPRAEEHSWGQRRTVDVSSGADGAQSLTQHVFMNADTDMPPHRHQTHDEIWTVTDGRGELTLDGRRIALRRGVSIRIPHGHSHAVHAFSDLQLILVRIHTSGSGLVSELLQAF